MTGIAALVLAAGTGSRYRAGGGTCATKLVDTVRGEPMIRHAVRAALAGGCDGVVVATGHAREAVEGALAGWPVRFAHNPDFATGLASSLRTGLLAIEAAGAVVMLGDMPLVDARTIVRLIEAAAAHPAVQAVVPLAADGSRGNPVLLRRSLFPAALRLTGDEGARRLLRDPAVAVLTVAVADDGIRLDIDHPCDLPR